VEILPKSVRRHGCEAQLTFFLKNLAVSAPHP
jgi:hypothetical protein